LSEIKTFAIVFSSLLAGMIIRVLFMPL